MYSVMSTNIELYSLQCDFFQVLLSSQFPKSRKFPENCSFFLAFPGMATWLSRGNTIRGRAAGATKEMNNGERKKLIGKKEGPEKREITFKESLSS
jgi:hypothetical protein